MLHLLGKLKRNTVAKQRVVEFGGNIAALGIDSRFALSNMTTEFGGIAGIFPADEQTAAFLTKREKKKRRKHIEIGTDSDAKVSPTAEAFGFGDNKRSTVPFIAFGGAICKFELLRVR